MKVYTVATKYGYELTGNLRRQKYPDGNTALLIGAEVVSVNLGAYGMNTPDEKHVFIPDYSQHEGITDELVKAGIVRKIRRVPIGYGEGWFCEITGEVLP